MSGTSRFYLGLVFLMLSNYRGARDMGLLTLWCTYFFPAVVGTWHFKKNVCKLLLSEILTVSDEAFVLTVVENYYDHWIAEGKLRAEGRDIKDLPKPKWTDSGTGGTGNVGTTCSSWKEEGLKKLNQNMVDINNLRKTTETKRLEEAFKTHVARKLGGSAGENESGYKRKIEEIIVYDDFSDDDGSASTSSCIGANNRQDTNDQSQMRSRVLHVSNEDEESEEYSDEDN